MKVMAAKVLIRINICETRLRKKKIKSFTEYQVVASADVEGDI